MNFATNIVITGFMGAGKTTVGQILARRLKRDFVDMDAVIEARAGMTIPQIFERQGEAAFRAQERRLIYELSLRSGLVIATGGGALIDEGMRDAMARNGMIVCLNASKADIRQRLAETANRPLAADWESLYETRAAAYARMPYQIMTTGKSPEEIAGEIAAIDGGALYVNTADGGGYPIYVGGGLLDWIGDDAESLGLGGHVVIVSNETVAPIYARRLRDKLPRADLVSVPDGEAHKTLETARAIYDQLLALGADRGTTLLALGGGVIGDMAGFAAATFMRGIALVQVPTTLLSMVDSSVGGKVGVDLPQGKNLIGAFKQPRSVIIDTEVLDTLPPLQWRCGMAEVIKHGLIAKPTLLEPELWRREHAERLVRQAVQVKIDVVEVDPYERGIRAHLNLGHTFGHAIEKATDYAIPHGEAVAIGTVKAARLSRNLGLIGDDLVERVLKIMWRLKLPTDIALDPERWYAAMSTDKKWKAGVSRLVVLKALGEAAVVEGLSKQEICAVL